MLPRSAYPSLIALLSFAVGCEVIYSENNNSSDGDNDYYEEPISTRSKRYSPALDVSNKFLEHMTNERFSDALSLFNKSAKGDSAPNHMKLFRDMLVEEYGYIVEYKPMQWGFTSRMEAGEDVLYSIKIVIREKSEVFYIFRFIDDGMYEEISRLQIEPRLHGARIIESVESILDEN